MELVEGESLDPHVVPKGLPLSRVLELSIPLADALVAAHEKGVVQAGAEEVGLDEALHGETAYIEAL